jgi:predicted O-methyltransferase YrrM
MRKRIRSALIQWFVKMGVVPSDMLLFYDDDCYEWHSGFGDFAFIMYSLVRSAKPDVVVEIGSAYGKSTCYIASALQRNHRGKLYSVDPHEKTSWNDGDETVDTFRIVSKRLSEMRLNPYVEILRNYSNKVCQIWNRKIDILLLDGAHGYEDVKADFYGFLPHLKPDSLIVFHDTMWEYHRNSSWYRVDQGVPRVVQELLVKGYPVVTLRESWGLSILQNSPGGFCLTPPNTENILQINK